jgi:hypothetical protein
MHAAKYTVKDNNWLQELGIGIFYLETGLFYLGIGNFYVGIRVRV